MNFARILFVFAAAFLVGCGGGEQFDSTRVTPPQNSPVDDARPTLQAIADTGEVGSGAAELRTLFEKIKETDAAKGDALLNDLNTLETTTDPAAAKAKAKEMLGKL
jgi:hypothetical protein